MKRMIFIGLLVFGLMLSWTIVSAEDDFYVIPTKKKNYAPVPKTGQTSSYATGDDGDLQMGVPWPDPRFFDNGDGTVTDELTGLIWLKNANCTNGTKIWSASLTFANSLYDGWTGDCGLSDGSSAGAWRLPNVRELHSLIDFARTNPALPAGHPFTGVQMSYYWSSTKELISANHAWVVSMYHGKLISVVAVTSHYVWPVRGGN